MKRILINISLIGIFFIGINSCSQEKKDARNLRGDWQRNIADFSSVVIDTVSFDRKHFYSKEGTFKYYLDDNYLIIEDINENLTRKYEYEFVNKEKIHLIPENDISTYITLNKIY